MTIVLGWDAAFCPDPIPAGDWCEVYIGGSSALRRTGWTPDEVARVAHLPKMPTWVPTPGLDNPRQTALECLAALKVRGVPAYATPWRSVLWDLETGREPDPAWFKVARGVMVANGYDTMSYGSLAWVFGEPNFTGLMVAKWDGDPELDVLRAQYPGALIMGKQYRAGVAVPGGQVDLDALDAAIMPHLGLWSAST